MSLNGSARRPEPNSPIRILLAEDNPGDVLMLKRALGQVDFPHLIDVASDGAVAWKLLTPQEEAHSGNWPHLLILDLNLPLMSGSEIVVAISTTPQLHNLPVVIMSSSSARFDREMARNLSCATFILKPNDLSAYMAVAVKIKEFWDECVVNGSDPASRFPD